MEKELFGQARSMAILALEELGKLSPVLGYIADPASHPSFVEECFGHKSKQLRGRLLSYMGPIMQRLNLMPSGDANSQNVQEWMSGFNSRLSELSSQLEAEAVKLIPELEATIKNAETGEIEAQRQEGLYVSFALDENSGVHLRHPKLVNKADAEKVLDYLSMYSDQTLSSLFEPLMKTYTSSLNDDSTWVDLISTLKQMLADMAAQLALNNAP
jgi:AbiV family abortive infection protein